MDLDLQIFVYGDDSGKISRDNNYPIIESLSENELVEFLKNLKYSTPYIYIENVPHFCINNPHLLPKGAYDFRTSAEYSNSFYSIKDNLELLKKQNINNNTWLSFGFTDFLNIIQ
jgi:hypothetical protein